MVRSAALITANEPSRYLQQLCRQFASEVPVVHTRDRGQILFLGGSCKLEGGPGVLTMVVEADDDALVVEIEARVIRQLGRLTVPEPPATRRTSLEGLKF